MMQEVAAPRLGEESQMDDSVIHCYEERYYHQQYEEAETDFINPANVPGLTVLQLVPEKSSNVVH